MPRAALILGWAGALPFLYAAYLAVPSLQILPVPTLGHTPQEGTATLISYGFLILAFMSGTLWGFAAPAGRPGLLLALSVLPALFAFFAAGAHPFAWAATDPERLLALALGFGFLLPFDLFFQQQAIAPAWWISLRLPITLVVIACLLGPLFL